MTKYNSLDWICKWYDQNCNGNWEHDFGIVIESLDNPGWSITIDTEGTSIELLDKPWILKENSTEDWYGYKISNGKFEASGDPMKLPFLINLFQKILNQQHPDGRSLPTKK